MGTFHLDYGVIATAFAVVGTTVFMADADDHIIRSYQFALERPSIGKTNSELRESVVVEASRNARPDARQFQCTAGHHSYEGS